ncbi:MAG: PQQ-binding-like beta-propeller repeat protein, partial [Candidatus Zixiibacteriota bacterium]
MLKRLISAVFVLGLVLALNGTAVSDVSKGPLNPVEKINPNVERFAYIDDARPEQPAFKKPETALREVSPGLTMPSPPQAYFCDIQDYTSGSPAYYWTLPDDYGDDLFNMRFTADDGYYCTLKVAYFLMYLPPQTGDPDMRVYLWDDDGFGFPGNKLDSVDILDPGAGATSNLYWASADFSAGNYVFSDGEEYHYGFTPILNTAADTLALISDAADGPYAGEERSSEYWNGLWGTMLNDWGLDVSFFILSERCCAEIPFTDCDYQSYWQNIAYYWRTPHPVWGDSAFAMRIDMGPGFDTLQYVDFMVYDPGNGSFGDDTVFIRIYGDDGAGLPNSADLKAQVALPPGSYNAFPTWTTAVFNQVFTEDIHVSFETSGDYALGTYESCLSSDGTDGVARSSSYWAGGPWVDMLSGWGVDVNFLIDPYICVDEFSVCQWNACYAGLAYFWRLPDRYGDVAQAQKFQATGLECRVQDVCFLMYWGYSEWNLPLYSTNSKVSVYNDAGGLPGTELASITVTPADWAAMGMVAPPSGGPSKFVWACFDFTPQNVTVGGDYWVAIEALTTDTLLGIRTLSDAGGGGCNDAWAENWAGVWGLMADDWGLPTRDWAMAVEALHCCVPFGGRTCYPGEDWFTYQHDYARTGASNNALGDAWCDLTVNWAYEDPTSGVSFCGPVVAGEGVVCAFSDHYIKFDLATGAIIYTLPYSPPMIGGSCRSTPTVATITGYVNPVLYVSGGDQNSIMAYDYITGALIWSRDITTVGVGGLFGPTRWGRFTVLNIAGVDVLYWGTDDGKVVAAEALTGALYPGWAVNPVDLSLSTWVSGSTDGTNLYYATFGAGVEGDIYSIDAATGAINWQLSTAGGLQGVNVWTHPDGYFGDEGFTAGVSYDNGTLYANSRATADHPTDGLFYSIDAGTGAVNFATLANRAYYQTPIIDINHVYMPSMTRWVGAPAGGQLYKVNRLTGNIDAVFSSASGGRYYVDGVLSCEPEPAEDLLYAYNEDGFLSCINTITFEEIYRRRVFTVSGYAPNIGMAGALAADPVTGESHLLFADYWGDLTDMTKQADRARLEIQSYSLQAPVEFG